MNYDSEANDVHDGACQAEWGPDGSKAPANHVAMVAFEVCFDLASFPYHVIRFYCYAVLCQTAFMMAAKGFFSGSVLMV